MADEISPGFRSLSESLSLSTIFELTRIFDPDSDPDSDSDRTTGAG
jgi:hypothetical protein